MSGGIFLIQSGGDLVEMKEQPYDTEDILQELLARYPNLLAGDQMDSAAPRRWLLVSREMGVPDEDGAAVRWLLDHLFLDQDAIPTLIEVKRSSDTRIRREVVGQMLDYAANAVLYWPVETLRARFERACIDRGAIAADELQTFLGPEANADVFWQKVKENLLHGRVRLVFVADEIPSELLRIVEFLNKQMDPAEVLAVEIKQFVGEGLKTLVPRVIGQTAGRATTKPPVRERKQWDEVSFFKVLNERPDPAVKIARRIYEWANGKFQIRWNQEQNGGFYLVSAGSKQDSPVGIRMGFTNAYAEINFGLLQKTPAFVAESKRVELQRRLKEIPGVSIKDSQLNTYPGIPLTLLADENELHKLLEVIDWVFSELATA